MVIEAEDARVFLATRFGGCGELVPMGAGEWSKAFAFRRQGRDYVIRFGAHQEDFAKDRLAAQYDSPGLPIPRVVELGEALDGYYAIAQRAFGGYIDELDEAQMHALLPSLFAALDAMRLADLSGTTGYGSWNAGGDAPYPTWQAALLDVSADRPADRIYGWRRRMAASAVGMGPFDEAYDRLQALAVSLPDERYLIHSDLLHYNVLVQDDRISGVLDWGCGMYGDFLYDLAWFCFWQPWFPAWQRIDFRADAERHYASLGLGVPSIEERLHCCQIHIGLASQAYMAHAGNWEDLRDTAQRTLDVACRG